MPAQPLLFDTLPRSRPRIVRMRVSDGGHCGDVDRAEEQRVCYRCRRCGHQTGWVVMPNLTEAKRGLPCPECNRGT